MKATDEYGSIRFRRVKKSGIWYEFIGVKNDYVGYKIETIDILKNISNGEMFSRRRKTIQKTDFDDVDWEVVVYRKKNYNTLKIIDKGKSYAIK